MTSLGNIAALPGELPAKPPKRRRRRPAAPKAPPAPKGTRRPRRDVEQARLAFIERVRMGVGVTEALSTVNRTMSTYRKWRTDPRFLAELELAKERARELTQEVPPPVVDFPTFCEKYLGHPLYWHQLQWVDLLEGRKPTGLHPAEKYEAGDPCYIMVNTPPEHAKSTTISIDYVTYRVCLDPNVQIILVSKTQERAKEFLYAIKTRLTHPRYRDLQEDFGPPGGWRSDAAVWASDRVYLGVERDTGEKDPTVQAIGIGGQIYGARSHLIIVDDGIVLSNSHQFETQARWLQQEVLTRLGPTGKLLLVGTRVDAMDLYRALREPERYPSGVSPWTYLAQPAVLAYGDTPEEWLTLWPRAQVGWSPSAKADSEGQFPRWDGRNLYRRRGMLNARTWALAYQQAEVEEDAVFDALKVRACINGMRQPGLMRKGQPHVRERGMDGLYVIGSMDPAMVGDTGVIIYAVDRFSKMRYVLDVGLRTSATPAWIRGIIKDWTEKYGVSDWRIERNAFQQFLTQDPDLLNHLGSMGVRLSEHLTNRNKWDAGFGVASMAVLFENGLIELPSTHLSEPTKQLVEQLITWSPETKSKTDLVMALWFAEIRAREVCKVASIDDDSGQRCFMPNKFLSKRGKSRQIIVNLNDLAAARQWG